MSQKSPRKGAGAKPSGAKPAGPRAAARTPAWRSPAAVAAGALALATIFLFRDVMLLGQVFLSPDSTAPVGFVRVGEEALRHGVYPLWNPYVFCGMPSFASLAYNPFIYPPDLPVWLVTHILPLPSTTWLVLYYFLAGLGAYLLGREWGAGAAASALAGLAFLSTPNLVAVGAHGHGSQLMDSAFVPWMLWLAARVFRRGRLTDVAWLALVTGFQMLRGHVQVCYYTWLAVGLYVVVEVARGGADRPELRTRALRAAGVGLAMGLGLALSAFLYLPVHDYAQYSIRGGGEGGGVGLDYATQWSFSPIEMLTFLVPGALGFGGPTYWGTMPFTDYPNYMGLGVLLLALVGAARARNPRILLYLGVLGVFALLVSFGHNGFLYTLLYDHLPYFNKFRVPVMILLLLQLAVAVLAGFGLDAVLEARAGGERAKRTRLAVGIALAVAGLVLVLGIAPDLWRGTLAEIAKRSRPSVPPGNLEAALSGAAGDAVRVGILAVLAIGAAWLAARQKVGASLFVGAVCLTAAIDLWVVDQQLMNPVLGPPQVAQQTNETDEIVDFLRQQAEAARGRGEEIRVLALSQDFQSNRLSGYRVASLTGYHAAKPKLADEYVQLIRGRLNAQQLPPAGFLRAAATTYWVIEGMLPPMPGMRMVYQGRQIQAAVYQDSAAVPRANLVTRVEALPYERHLARLSEQGYDPSAQVLLAEAPPGPLGPPGGSVKITRYDLNSVDMEADAPGPAILRFADLYFPGWTARVDGQPAPVWRADFCFRAIPLAAGRPRVEWKYEPRALTLGLWVSALALAAIGALFAAGAWRSRRVSAGR